MGYHLLTCIIKDDLNRLERGFSGMGLELKLTRLCASSMARVLEYRGVIFTGELTEPGLFCVL